MTSTRGQDGFTLVEMLVVCVVSLLVFGATMAAFSSMYGQNRAVEQQRDNVEEARVALDRAARQLRNLANPTYTATETIARANGYDFIFQTSDPAKTWVRYCLSTSAPGASPVAGRLWASQSATATLTEPMKGACPGTGWTSATGGSQQIVTTHVTNTANGIDRDVFTYGCTPGSPTGCPSSTTDLPKITTVGARLFVDADPGDRVKEVQVASGIFLRNQNEPPTAYVSGPERLGPYKIALNGTGSSDPEGRTLDYYWFQNVAPPPAELANCTTTPPSAVWHGPMLVKQFPSSEAGRTHNFWLVVRDPGCLTSSLGPRPVIVPR